MFCEHAFQEWQNTTVTEAGQNDVMLDFEDIITDPIRRQNILDDCVLVLEQEIALKKGFIAKTVDTGGRKQPME